MCYKRSIWPFLFDKQLLNRNFKIPEEGRKSHYRDTVKDLLGKMTFKVKSNILKKDLLQCLKSRNLQKRTLLMITGFFSAKQR